MKMYFKIAGCLLLMVVLTMLGLKNSSLRKKVAKKKAETEKLKHDVKVEETKDAIIKVKSDIQKLSSDKKKNSLMIGMLEDEEVELMGKMQKGEEKIAKTDSTIKDLSDALAYAERIKHDPIFR